MGFDHELAGLVQRNSACTRQEQAGAPDANNVGHGCRCICPCLRRFRCSYSQWVRKGQPCTRPPQGWPPLLAAGPCRAAAVGACSGPARYQRPSHRIGVMLATRWAYAPPTAVPGMRCRALAHARRPPRSLHKGAPRAPVHRRPLVVTRGPERAPFDRVYGNKGAAGRQEVRRVEVTALWVRMVFTTQSSLSPSWI